MVSIKSLFDSMVMRNLTNLASKTYEEIIRNLDGGVYPSGDSERGTEPIQNSLSVTPVRGDRDKNISIMIDLKKSPFALAYEYGSGIHGEDGSTYVISPKKSSVLAFYWDKYPVGPGRKFIGYGVDGRHMFKYVDHPGIVPRPYLRPAMMATRPFIKKIMMQGIKESLTVENKMVRIVVNL